MNGNTTVVGDVSVSNDVSILNHLSTGSFRMNSTTASGYIMMSDASGNANWTDPLSLGTGLWTLSDSDIINNNTGMVKVNGALSIGSVTNAPSGYSLYVEKGIITEKLKVALKTDSTNWSDFVFAKNYKLRSLSDVEKYYLSNHHLPEVPSAAQVSSNGIDVAKMDATLLQKIEELTLYVVAQQKDIEALKAKLNISK